MAVVVDHESEYKGERKVRDAIAEHFSDEVVVYNNREVNGREYDICLLVKDVCVFIVEIKGWLSDKINVHGIDDRFHYTQQTLPIFVLRPVRLQILRQA